MTPDERKKAIKEMTNDIVNNMSVSEMMAIVVEKAKQIAEQRVDRVIVQYISEPLEEEKLIPSLWSRVKKLFKRNKKHKGFATKS
jgi:hypothetical protein